jgi:acyl-[acyl-carrier-protein]-phospholipid O-acyltransferase/long-chain-fatty-acid--[acyl-carrier-protein] ligase
VSAQNRSPLRGLLVAQALASFVDYAWKFIVTLLLQRGIDGPDAPARLQGVLTIVTVVFGLPLALGALPALPLVDRFSKRSVILATRWFELSLMLIATALLALRPEGGHELLWIVGAMGVCAATFSPAKYGVLPQIVEHAQLSQANAWIELSTLVAIVAGTACGGQLLGVVGASTWMAPAVLAGLCTLGVAAAASLPPVPASGTRSSWTAAARGAARAIRGDRQLGLAIAGSALFWSVASLIGQNIVAYGRIELGLPEAQVGVPLAVMSIGVGLGCLAAARLSHSKVEIGLLPLGASLLAALTFVFVAAKPGFYGSLAWMTTIGAAGGLLVVPLNALIQWRAPASQRGAVIAGSNFFVFSGALAGSLACGWLAHMGFSTAEIFATCAGVVALGALWAFWLAPLALVRLTIVVLTQTIYHVRVRGIEHVPRTGGALLVPNHVSFADGLFLLASTDRPIRFLVDAPFFDKPFVGQMLRWLDAIPISSTGGPRVILRALRSAGEHLDAGHIVCIFAEGQITRTGMLLPFRRGLERIVKGRNVPILPVYLEGLWGSIFSFQGGRFGWKFPQKVPYAVGVSFGAPIAPGTPLHIVRRAVQTLGQEAWCERFASARPLQRSFVKRVRSKPLRTLFADATRPRVTRLQALAGSIALARKLRERWGADEHVGILLPPSVGGALVNLAAAFAGRTTVNLNYTAGVAGMASAAKQAGLRSVVTSRVFLEKAKLELPEGLTPHWIDELAAEVSAFDRVAALGLACLAPARWIEAYCGAKRAPTADDVVTVIFSSGSTGEPKGVMLSHANIASNCAALDQIFHVAPREKVLGILPFFHSFGFTATIWFPATSELGAVFHPSPIDAPAIGELVERHQISFLLATPTLLSIYLRRIAPAQFGSLRLVLAGAEKLSERLANAFEDQFGIRPLEGYGATECAPVIAASQLDFRAAGFYQPGWRRGFVGQPLPGVVCRVVDPDTFEDLPPNTPGMLLVRGPNVMRGYLGRPELTQKALRDGWYVTGDIAVLDDDSFLKITDRLSRFSKIGGEMVPHGRVEEELHKAAGLSVPTFLVTALPDEKKGERLAVLTTLALDQVPSLVEKLSNAGLPNLFLPRADAFVKVDELPVLGTGKSDLRAAKQIASERLAAR